MKYHDYAINQQFICPKVSVTLAEIMDYAKKYDPLPIHLDQQHVEKTRFKKIFASGFQTLNITWGAWAASPYWNEDVIAGISIDYVKWLLPLYPDDILTPIVTVVDLLPTSSDKQGIVVLNMKAYNQNQQEVIDCTVKSLIAK